MRHNVWRAAVLLTVPAFAFGTSTASAAPPGDPETVQQQLVKSSAALSDSTAVVRLAQRALDNATRGLPAAKARLSAARAAEVTATTQYESTSATTAALQKTARQAATAQQRAEQQVTDALAELDGYASAAYQAGPSTMLSFVLAAQSPADLATGREIMRRQTMERTKVVGAVTVARTQAARLRADADRLAVKAQGARDHAASLLSARSSAAASAAAAESQIAQLVAKRDSTLRAAQAARAAEEQRYADLQAQSSATASRLGSGTGLANRTANGKLSWPVRGVITSQFGYRLDPVFGVWRLHAGLDIAAPGGQPITAADAGVVVDAGWAGGYGNYTCISHGVLAGRGVATCYAHQSAILVRAGDRVRQGQLIGRVGTTGASTGNHLHFEVRIDGTPVSPLDWL